MRTLRTIDNLRLQLDDLIEGWNSVSGIQRAFRERTRNGAEQALAEFEALEEQQESEQSIHISVSPKKKKSVSALYIITV